MADWTSNKQEIKDKKDKFKNKKWQNFSGSEKDEILMELAIKNNLIDKDAGEE